MTPEQRRRASAAVRSRMNELKLTVPQLASAAGVDETTVRSLLAGSRWPRVDTRARLNKALRWPPGEIARRAETLPELAEFPSAELLAELYRRSLVGDHMPMPVP